MFFHRPILHFHTRNCLRVELSFTSALISWGTQQTNGCLWLAAIGLALFGGTVSARAADKPVKKIAPTVAEAAKVFDPANFPVLKTEEPVGRKYVGGFSYQAKTDPQAGFKFYQQALSKRKWKELPDSYVTETSCSGMFGKDGYLISLSLTPVGDDGEVLVSIHNHSNIPLKKLPVPKGVKPFYSVPTAEASLTEQPREETAAAVTKLLVEQGWEPYGTAGDQMFFKQNAVRLSANVATAPAQDNKTVITYSADQMSADIPAPAETSGLQYSDSTKAILFDVDSDLGTIHKFYNDVLAKADWKPTTDKPILIGFKQTVIYRNPAKDLLELEMFEVEGKLRVEVKHQSAEEVAEIDRQVEAAVAEKKKAVNKPQPKLDKLAISLPAEAQDVEAEKSEIKFTIGDGKAKPFAEALRKKLKADGWKETSATLDAMAGAVLLDKGDQKLQIIYLETGVLPAEVTISGDGLELEQAKKK